MRSERLGVVMFLLPISCLPLFFALITGDKIYVKQYVSEIKAIIIV